MKHAFLAAAIAAFSGSAWADGAIELRTAPGAFASDAAARQHIEQTLRGADADIEFVDAANGVVRLEGGEAAARALRADPVFVSVRHDGEADRQTRLFSVLLSDEGMQVGVEPGGRGDRIEDVPLGWPGEFVQVIARDASGTVIAEGYVRDHRFIRYEGWNEDGTHRAGSNYSDVDETQPLDIWLELPAATARLEVIAPARPAENLPERTLGVAAINAGEAQ
ncbi:MULTISPECIES: hypothetical protein [Hyphobacterium]|uniref:NolW-like domain-containing protein n=1 Tax=Hyphobacterium vulgare TaxID=1736751 RepID=A0ABV7A072_9PROT